MHDHLYHYIVVTNDQLTTLYKVIIIIREIAKEDTKNGMVGKTW